MGVDADPAVDRNLRVYGLTGLRIVDASVRPSIPAGSTNVQTIVIAEKAAEGMRHFRPIPAKRWCELNMLPREEPDWLFRN
jgi:choline dehydrogenase